MYRLHESIEEDEAKLDKLCEDALAVLTTGPRAKYFDYAYNYKFKKLDSCPEFGRFDKLRLIDNMIDAVSDNDFYEIFDATPVDLANYALNQMLIATIIDGMLVKADGHDLSGLEVCARENDDVYSDYIPEDLSMVQLRFSLVPSIWRSNVLNSRNFVIFVQICMPSFAKLKKLTTIQELANNIKYKVRLKPCIMKPKNEVQELLLNANATLELGSVSESYEFLRDVLKNLKSDVAELIDFIDHNPEL